MNSPPRPWRQRHPSVSPPIPPLSLIGGRLPALVNDGLPTASSSAAASDEFGGGGSALRTNASSSRSSAATWQSLPCAGEGHLLLALVGGASGALPALAGDGSSSGMRSPPCARRSCTCGALPALARARLLVVVVDGARCAETPSLDPSGVELRNLRRWPPCGGSTAETPPLELPGVELRNLRRRPPRGGARRPRPLLSSRRGAPEPPAPAPDAAVFDGGLGRCSTWWSEKSEWGIVCVDRGGRAEEIRCGGPVHPIGARCNFLIARNRRSRLLSVRRF